MNDLARTAGAVVLGALAVIVFVAALVLTFAASVRLGDLTVTVVLVLALAFGTGLALIVALGRTPPDDT